MTWSWIDLNFPWVGLGAAVLLVVLLFGTRRLQGNLQRPRQQDLTCLSWLAVPIYLLHNVEEYGMDFYGHAHAFPAFMCATLGQPPYPACAIPPAFYLAVNLPLFWVGAPIAAWMSRRHSLIGLSYYGAIFVNALAHLASFARTGYNPGVLTALALFLPSSLWVARACFGKHALPYATLAFLVAEGVVIHVVLMGSVVLFLRGLLGPSLLIAIQVMNAGLLFLLAWLAERWRAGVFIDTHQAPPSS